MPPRGDAGEPTCSFKNRDSIFRQTHKAGVGYSVSHDFALSSSQPSTTSSFATEVTRYLPYSTADELRVALDKFNKMRWESQVECLHRISSSINGISSRDFIVEHLRQSTNVLISAINNLRSVVSGVAISAVNTLFLVFRSQVDSELSLYIPVLMGKLTESSKVFLANQAIDVMVSCVVFCTPRRILFELLGAADPRSPVKRAAFSWLLYQFLIHHGDMVAYSFSPHLGSSSLHTSLPFDSTQSFTQDEKSTDFPEQRPEHGLVKPKGSLPFGIFFVHPKAHYNGLFVIVIILLAALAGEKGSETRYCAARSVYYLFTLLDPRRARRLISPLTTSSLTRTKTLGTMTSFLSSPKRNRGTYTTATARMESEEKSTQPHHSSPSRSRSHSRSHNQRQSYGQGVNAGMSENESRTEAASKSRSRRNINDVTVSIGKIQDSTRSKSKSKMKEHISHCLRTLNERVGVFEFLCSAILSDFPAKDPSIVSSALSSLFHHSKDLSVKAHTEFLNHTPLCPRQRLLSQPPAGPSGLSLSGSSSSMAVAGTGTGDLLSTATGNSQFVALAATASFTSLCRLIISLEGDRTSFFDHSLSDRIIARPDLDQYFVEPFSDSQSESEDESEGENRLASEGGEEGDEAEAVGEREGEEKNEDGEGEQKRESGLSDLPRKRNPMENENENEKQSKSEETLNFTQTSRSPLSLRARNQTTERKRDESWHFSPFSDAVTASRHTNNNILQSKAPQTPAS